MPGSIDHEKLQAMTYIWLGARSWRLRWSPEVTLNNDYRADAVGIQIPQREFRRQIEGVNEEECYFLSHVFEIKVSVADFRNHFGNGNQTRHDQQYGHMNWVVCPAKMVKPEDVPDPWGLLTNLGGRGMKIEKWPRYLASAEDHIAWLEHCLLWKKHPWWLGQYLLREGEWENENESPAEIHNWRHPKIAKPEREERA